MGISSVSALSALASYANSNTQHLRNAQSAADAHRAPGRTEQLARQHNHVTEVLEQNRAQHAVVEKLRARDREVRAHEQAHVSRASGLAKGGPRFTFQRGPDGRLYAVSGRVQLDTSPVPGNPEATIRKAQQIRAAALAPANPSAQDRAVAASATRMEAQARLEMQAENRQDRSRTGLAGDDSAPSPVGKVVDFFA